MPPAAWKVGAHAKHLRNLYVYFWRWATWKVFDHHPDSTAGIVCFISVAGFLNGPGFQKMRWDLRRRGDEVWVIDCSPEGHQPEANTRIFQDVQQPICIVLASRSPKKDGHVPAAVRFRALPAGNREAKFQALQTIRLHGDGWLDSPRPPTEQPGDVGSDPGWRAPFLPAATGAWGTYPKLEDLFIYHGSGVNAGQDLDHRTGRGLSGAKVAAARERPARGEGAPLPPAPPRRRTGRQTRQQAGQGAAP